MTGTRIRWYDPTTREIANDDVTDGYGYISFADTVSEDADGREFRLSQNLPETVAEAVVAEYEQAEWPDTSDDETDSDVESDNTDTETED